MGHRTSLYVPDDLTEAADAAKKAGRSLTDILRSGFAAEGFTQPAVPVAELRTVLRDELAPLLAAIKAQPEAARRARDMRESDAATDCPPHPPGRVHKGLCGACGRHVS